MINPQKFFNLITGSCVTFSLIITISSCQQNSEQTIRLGISSENLIFEESLKSLTKKATGKSATIVAKGSLSLTKLACSGNLDAIAIADEMWPKIKCPDASWVDTSGTLYQTRIQFALPKKTAQALGWDQKTVPRQEILEKLQSGQLKLATTIPTYSNSGYNTLLWLTREAITPNLTPKQVTPQTLQPLQPIYQNLAKSSESTAYLAEKLAQDWPPNTLAALYRFLYVPDGTALYHKGQKLPLKEPVTLIEVSPAIPVTPTWFVTTQDETLKQQLIEGVFTRLETENAKQFQELNALNPPLPATVTRETTPIAQIHRRLLDNFHPSIRQKRWIVGIVDASGSMRGKGYNQLLGAFAELLDPQNAKDNFLYSPDDRFSLIIYQGNRAYAIPRDANPAESSRESLWQTLKNEVKPNGGTPVDQGLRVGFDTALKVPSDYKIEIFLFTDGQFANPITPELLQSYQLLQNQNAEFTIVGAGNVDAQQLRQLSGQFDARPIISNEANETLEELLKAFREAQI